MTEDNEMLGDEVLRGMDEAMRRFPEVSPAVDLREPPNRFCEVWIRDHVECGKPATKAYPAKGGGYMALCHFHAQKHPEAWPIQEI